MTLSVEIRSSLRDQEAQAFDAFLDSLPDSLVQQSILWSEAIRDIGPDEPFHIAVKDSGAIAGVLTVYLYRHELGNILFSNPQAGSMGSLAVHPAADAASVARLLLDAATDLALNLDCVCLTLTSNPFAKEDTIGTLMGADYSLCNRVHYLLPDDCFDGNGEYAISHSKFRNNLKRNLLRAEEAGLRVEESYSPEHLLDWYGIHCTRMEEIRGIPLPFPLFRKALEIAVPSDRAAFHYVLDERGRVQGGGFHIYNSRIADIFMMSTTREGQVKGANYLLVHEALKWAKAKGIRVYNWQASNPPEGSVARFKEQWGSRTAIYHYYTKVLGDLGPVLGAGIRRVRDAYRWHYVVPFAIFTDRGKRAFSKTDSEAFLPA
ncbi:MAG: GNAT family N-acetyltransferase [Thermodesulfobacteriota bacterium]